jgi:hypothetical protein
MGATRFPTAAPSNRNPLRLPIAAWFNGGEVDYAWVERECPSPLQDSNAGLHLIQRSRAIDPPKPLRVQRVTRNADPIDSRCGELLHNADRRADQRRHHLDMSRSEFGESDRIEQGEPFPDSPE